MSDGTRGSQHQLTRISINGPATANYDVDLGTYALTDWYHITAFQAARRAFESGQKLGGPPTSDNILVNGVGNVNKFQRMKIWLTLPLLDEQRHYQHHWDLQQCEAPARKDTSSSPRQYCP